MEAAASGVPSIATDSGAPREIVDDGVTGIVVPPGDPGALSSAIARMQSSPALVGSMGEAALAKSADFTWGRSVDTFERVLEEAVAGSRT
jgi:glycosyltransferase involved in cell wall biosynthesis